MIVRSVSLRLVVCGWFCLFVALLFKLLGCCSFRWFYLGSFVLNCKVCYCGVCYVVCVLFWLLVWLVFCWLIGCCFWVCYCLIIVLRCIWSFVLRLINCLLFVGWLFYFAYLFWFDCLLFVYVRLVFWGLLHCIGLLLMFVDSVITLLIVVFDMMLFISTMFGLIRWFWVFVWWFSCLCVCYCLFVF